MVCPTHPNIIHPKCNDCSILKDVRAGWHDGKPVKIHIPYDLVEHAHYLARWVVRTATIPIRDRTDTINPIVVQFEEAYDQMVSEAKP